MVALAVLLAGCAPASITTQGRQTHWLYNFFMWCAAGVFLLVSALIVISIFRDRRTDDELPRQVHGNNKLEATWTILPLLLVLVLFYFTIKIQDKVNHQVANPGLTIDVRGFQWSWLFAYEGSGAQVIGGPGRPPTMVVPVDEVVHIRLTSADVVHSFYIPRTLFKRYAIPGKVNEFDLTFDRTGTYDGHCVQYCGLSHAQMVFDVKVVSQNDFQRFLRSARSGTPGGTGT